MRKNGLCSLDGSRSLPNLLPKSRSTTPSTKDHSRLGTPSTRASSSWSSSSSSDVVLSELDDESSLEIPFTLSHHRCGGFLQTSSPPLAKESTRLLVGLPGVLPAWNKATDEDCSTSKTRSLKSLAGTPARALRQRRSRSQASGCKESEHCVLPPPTCSNGKGDRALANAFREFAVGRRDMQWCGFERLANHCCIFDSKFSVEQCHHLFNRLLGEGGEGMVFEQFKNLLQHIAFERRVPVSEMHLAVLYSIDLGMQHRQRKVLNLPTHVRRPCSIGSGSW